MTALTLITTEEMLKSFSISMRVLTYTAIDCANHLALYSKRDSAIVHDIAGQLGDMATQVRMLSELYEHPRSGQ